MEQPRCAPSTPRRTRTSSLMAKDADFWEAMYRAVIRRLGEITNSDDDHRTLMFEAVTRAHIDSTGTLLVDQVSKEKESS